MKSRSVTIHMKATEQYFFLVLFIMLYKECSNFEAVDEIINQVSWSLLLSGAVCVSISEQLFLLFVCFVIFQKYCNT